MTVRSLLRNPNSEGGGGAAVVSGMDTGGVSVQGAGLTDQQKIDNALAASKPDDAAKGAAKNVKPMMAKEPPKELLEKEIGVEDDDLSLIDEERPAQGKKTEAKKEEAPKKEEVKADVKIEVKPPAKEEGKADTRDYSGYSADEVAVLKQMSNPAFDFATGLIKQLKAVPKEGQLPPTYMEHPDAYMLSPDHKKAEGELRLIDAEANHYRQQLINVRAGKPWMRLTGFDQKTGEPILDGPYKATDDAEIDLGNAMTQMQMIKGQVTQRLEGYKNHFKAGVEASVAEMKKISAERFSWVADPKLLDEKVDVGGGKTNTIKELQAGFKSMFNPVWHSNPLLDVGSNLFVGLQIYAAKIRDLEAQLGKTQKEKAAITRMEPVVEGAAANGSAKSRQDVVFDMEDLPRD